MEQSFNSTDWLKAEYDQLNDYSRCIYEMAPKLTQTTFIINPALAAAYAYATEHLQLVVFAGFISILGIIFNIGALMFYSHAQNMLASIYERIVVIENSTGGKLHLVFGKHWWRTRQGRSTPPMILHALSLDFWTRVFFYVLIFVWFAALLKLFY